MDSEHPPATQTQCMGAPVAGVDFRVLDSHGQPLPGEQPGELAVKLDHLCLPPHELTADGYYRTGDHGYRDHLGRIHVLGRLTPFTDERQFATSGGD